MRDPKRIDKILRLVKKIWKKSPYLRLCQLLGNCFEEHDLYYIEDDFLVGSLKKRYRVK